MQGTGFDLLFITRNTMSRLKDCMIEKYQQTLENEVVPFHSLNGMKAMLLGRSTVSFEFSGRAASISLDYNETERVEIVKRLDAYEGL